jgi:hypothetical protein
MAKAALDCRNSRRVFAIFRLLSNVSQTRRREPGIQKQQIVALARHKRV